VRAPPAAAWPVTDDLRWRAAQALLWALAAGSLGAWLGQHAHDRDLASVLGAAAGALAGALVGALGGGQRGGELRWTGSQWRWCEAPRRAGASAEADTPGMPLTPATPVMDPAGQPIAAPEVMLDLQGWMLLRWRPATGKAWQWRSVGRGALRGAVAADAAPRWAAFRAAVYSAASRNDGFSGPESRLP
jgi:hypothetical protein